MTHTEVIASLTKQLEYAKAGLRNIEQIAIVGDKETDAPYLMAVYIRAQPALAQMQACEIPPV